MIKLLFLATAWLLAYAPTMSARAAEEERGGPPERLERLERRLDELAQRQEQMMQRLRALPEQPRPAFRPGPEGVPSPIPPGPLVAAARAKAVQDLAGLLRLAVLACILCNILLAVWIFTDIRKRGEGPGIFVALALVAGIPAALIYSLVRLGDRKT